MEKVVYRVPFAKVDEQRRIVSGFATLNNLDSQRDIVSTEASVKAFTNFRGNIREQHTKIAAGKMLSFGVEKFLDKVSGKVYDGIFVRAYVSKGAQDTWEKVLDGTLSGFSIGGEIIDFENIIDEDGNPVRVVKDYNLTELSLVDNPANPLANVLAVEKAHGFFADMAESVEEKELDYMASEDVEKAVDSDSAMTETVEVAEAPVEVAEVAEVVEEVAVEEEPAAEAVAEEAAPEIVEETVEEVVAEAPSNDADVLGDAINEIKALLEDRDNKTASAFESIIDQLKELRGGIDGANATANNVAAELASVKSTVSEFDKRVANVENDTAVRKSGDLGEVAQESNTRTQKSLWGGRFLTADHNN